MRGVQNPRVRPYAYPGARMTFGPWRPMIPAQSFQVPQATRSESGQQQPTEWTPNGLFAPGARVFRPMPYARLMGSTVSMSPQRSAPGYFTPPALWNLTSMHGAFLTPSPSRRRAGTVKLPSTDVNPFPSFAPPLPSYPAPASWIGRL